MQTTLEAISVDQLVAVSGGGASPGQDDRPPRATESHLWRDIKVGAGVGAVVGTGLGASVGALVGGVGALPGAAMGAAVGAFGGAVSAVIAQ